MVSNASNGNSLLSMRNIDKSFPGVHALRNVDLDLDKGEVLALLGENGAGKSTLIKVLSGAHLPDAGSIEISGAPVSITNPITAQNAGIGVIYQEFNLVPALTAWENIFLGNAKSRFGFVRQADERAAAAALFDRIGVQINPDQPCRDLTIAQQQVVEIAKALSQRASIIVMDEPSATLTSAEVESLFNVIRELKSQGIGVIYISHRLDEIFEIADRVAVMRDGRMIQTASVSEVDRRTLIEWMVGRTIENEFPKHTANLGDVRLDVRGLNRGDVVRDVSFNVHRGEVLGITGLVGAGRTETARLIFGADIRDGGEITLDGVVINPRSPRQAIAAGICLLTEDRKSQGLVLNHSVLHNFGLPNLGKLSRCGVVRQAKERDRFAGYIKTLQIKAPHADQHAGNLSGGNQQKVVLAKWLESNSEVVIFDEPTRGIDVGAKYEIYLLINKLAAAGKAIIMISSELPEILGMSDRILVMHEGRVTGEITDVPNATQEQIMELAVQ